MVRIPVQAPQEIPLFPLNVVLYPSARLPLRIFEDRYKLLYEDSLKAGASFGIVLIKEGQEVGGPATPHDVGTFVEIEAVDYRKESIFLLCKGTGRFRIKELRHDRPYLIGVVEPLPDMAMAPDDAERVHDLGKRFDEYLDRMQRVAAALGGELQIPKPPHGKPPREAAYGIAAAMPIALGEKQDLLEVDELSEFVQRLLRAMERELSFLQPDDAP